MASILHFLAISLFCSFLLVSCEPQTQSRHPQPTSKPNLLILPVQRDANTGLHWANLLKRTPLTQVPVLVDLNGKNLWVNCEQHYSSSTYQAPFCHSTQCARANIQQQPCHTCPSAPRPGCHNNTCGLESANPVTQQTAVGELAQDLLAIFSTRGSSLGPMVRVPQFLFSCAPSFLAQKGLPNNVQGVAGLAQYPISLPNQLASHFGLPRQFTMFLSRDPKSYGAVLFGDVPSNLRDKKNQPFHFSDLAYTPLTITPQGEYHMHVSSIRINQHTVVPVIPSLLSSYPKGSLGGTLISTTIPYTVLHQSIFEAFTQVFAQQLPRQAQVKPVAPFGLCFNSKSIGRVPSVDLVLDRPDAVWRITGENLMVQAQPGVTCLGLVNGGLHPRAAMAIGARQLEENPVVFDLARSRLGFSNSLNSRGIKCADLFDFTNPP